MADVCRPPVLLWRSPRSLTYSDRAFVATNIRAYVPHVSDVPVKVLDVVEVDPVFRRPFRLPLSVLKDIVGGPLVERPSETIPRPLVRRRRGVLSLPFLVIQEAKPQDVADVRLRDDEVVVDKTFRRPEEVDEVGSTVVPVHVACNIGTATRPCLADLRVSPPA